MSSVSPPYDLAVVRARSDLLTQISHLTYISRDEARHLTNLTSTQLARLAEEGTILAEYTHRGYHHFSTRTLLKLLRQRAEPLSLFDVLRTAATSGQFLSDDELAVDETDIRDRRDLQVRGARCYRLIRRDHVAPTTPAWAAWYRGRNDLAQQLLLQQRERFAVERSEFASRGLSLTTLWIPRRPLTPYGRYLVAALDQAHLAGQHIRVENPDQVECLEVDAPLPEFTVYEAAVVYLRTYTCLGRPDGALKIADPELAAHLCEQMRSLCRDAQAFEDFREGVA